MMMKRIILSLVIAFSVPVSPAIAQNVGQNWSPDAANDARKDGKIIPLKDIFRKLKKSYGGRQLDADLYSLPGGGYEYRIDWETGSGEHKTFIVDAVTGRVREA